MLELEVIKKPEDFYALKDNWNSLLEQSGIDNPHLTYEWLSSWYKAYEKNNHLNIISFKDNGRIIGLIPLVITRQKFHFLPLKTAKFFCDHWGRMDFILTAQKQECLHLFIDWFYSNHTTDILILSRLPWESENVRLFQQLIENKRVRFEKYTLKNSFVRINQTWEEYLATRSKNFAEELKYKKRKIAKKGNVSYERLKVLADAELVISLLSDINKNSWKEQKQIGVTSTKEGKTFYKNLMEAWGENGNLDLSILKLNNKPIAFALRINSNGNLYALETSFDQNYYDYSPGMLVQGYLLQELFNETKLQTYELGEVEGHKSRWTNEVKEEKKYIIYGKNTISKICFYLRNLFKHRNSLMTS